MTVALDVGPLRAEPAGVGMYVRSLAKGLAQIGRSDLVYIGRRADADGLPAEVPSLRRGGIPYLAWVQCVAPLDLRRAKAGLAHFTDGVVPFVRSKPAVVTVHDLSVVAHWRAHPGLRYARIPLALAAPRLATRVLADSRATADEIIRLTGVAASKVDVVPLAGRESIPPVERDMADAVRRMGLDSGGYLLVPGTIEPRKNHVRVVDAFNRLAADPEVPRDITLVIAGRTGWKAQPALDAIASSPFASRIKVLGYVNDADMASLMGHARAVVYVSTYEGFGLPVLEGMAAGAPVVTSNVSSMPEVGGDAAILVDPFNPTSIERGMRTVLDADTAARDASRRQAARFSWSATAAATAAIYDRLA